MFTERQQQILNILEKTPDFITSEEIARRCGVSAKTVRNEIKLMQEEIPEHSAIITVSKRHGIRLDVQDPEMWKQYAVAISEDSDGGAREKMILKLILMHTLQDEPLLQQKLVDSLYVSLSSIKASMKDVREELETFHLTVVNHRNQGMMVKGMERDIRHCLYEHLGHRAGTSLEQIGLPFSIHELRTMLIRVLAIYDMMLTDDSLRDAADYIAIALLRASHGHNISYRLQESKMISSHKEYRIASAVFDEIYEKFHIDVDTNEIYYITQLLIMSRRYTATEHPVSDQISQLTEKMLERVCQIVGLDFREDEVLSKGLRSHLEIVVPRIRFHIRIHNEVLDVVKNEYPLAFQIGIIAAKVIEEQIGETASEDEVGYIAIHFGAALTRRNIDHTRNVRRTAFVICGSGIGTSVLLKARLEEYFKEVLSVVKVMPGYCLKDADIQSADLLISTMPLEELPELPSQAKKKLVVVPHLLDHDEVELVKTKLFHTSKAENVNLAKFFHRECFQTNMSFSRRDEVLHYMTQGLEKLGLMDKDIAMSVFERENASPTEIGNLVAIPHPLINNTAISAISVVILDKPILWSQMQVQVIFLISIAKEEFYLWEPIFLKLFKYLVKENGVRHLIATVDFDQFMIELRQHFE